jgi:protein-tyrosine-phosphatase
LSEPGTLNRVWNRARSAPLRALHARRRARATKRLRGRLPSSVLFLCHGNACRSPFAAALFAREAAAKIVPPIRVESAGLVAPGRPSPAAAIAAAARRGIDLSRHRSRLVTTKAIAGAQLVVVMSADQARVVRRVGRRDIPTVVLGDLDPQPMEERTIVDPMGESDDVFDASYDRITRCIDLLIDLLVGPRSE